MTTVATEIKALISGAQRVAGIVKKIDSSEALQARFDESVEEVHREVAQVCFAVCKALVAHALGVDPSQQQVNDFMTAAVNDPAFPNRAFRQLGEMRKAASQRRRAFLAAMLFGLPFAKLPDDERDRIDMAVERMTVPDVEFLSMVSRKRRAVNPDPMVSESYVFGPAGMVALLHGNDLRIATPDDWHNGHLADRILESEAFIADRAALASLESVGCATVGQSAASVGNWKVHHLLITPLGDSVLRALEQVRPGFDSSER